MRVLSLCDYTGTMVAPWVDAGHYAMIVDLQHPPGWDATSNPARIGSDVANLDPDNFCAGAFDIVFAFPPCTHLANSGARWMQEKGLDALVEALTVVNACLKLCIAVGAPWMLENPVGQLSAYMGPPSYRFDPYEYGGYPGGENDGYTKKTCLWTGGGFVMPPRRPIDGTEGSRMHLIAPGPERQNIRSATPRGFAQAVFEANSQRIAA